jgi:hypothetical protein
MDNVIRFDSETYQEKLIEQGYTPEQAMTIAEKYEVQNKKTRSSPKAIQPELGTLPQPQEPKVANPVPATPAKSLSEMLAVEQEEAEQAGGIGYMARAMILSTMPHSRPKETYFSRKNGKYTLNMQANQEIGLPYGAIPRLLIGWMTQEAVRTKERELLLGDSLSAFMEELGFIPSGGKRGTIPALKNQMRRLFTTSVSCTYSDEEREAGVQMFLVDKYNLWWFPKDPDQRSLWQSTITLSGEFFQEITTSPVPIRMSTLEALKGSSMALDIYFWLTYRNFYARRPSRIPWEALQMQFGAGYPDTPQGKRDFKKNFLLALKKVAEVYPEARKLRVETDALVYVPGYPDVSPIV